MRARAAVRAMLALGATSVCLVGGCGGENAGPRPEPAACGEIRSVSDTPDPGSGPADCAALDGLELYMIDDFEPGSSRTGWYVDNDRTALQSPLPQTDPFPTSEVPGGRCVGYDSDNPAMICSDPTTPRGRCERVADLASQRAVHIRTGFLSRDGGKIGKNFAKVGCLKPDADDPETLCPYRGGPPETGPCSTAEPPSPPLKGCRAALDFSDWDGVVVWARKAPGSFTNVRVRFSDVRTDEAACVCNPYTDQNDTSDGCDKFGTYISLDTDFQPFFLPFDEMQQGGWGLCSPGLDTSELLSVGVEYGRGVWDIWIDDIAFYRSIR